MPALALLLLCQLAQVDSSASAEDEQEPSRTVIHVPHTPPPPDDENAPSPPRQAEQRWIPVAPPPPVEQLEATVENSPASNILASLIQLAGVLALQACGLASLGGLTAFGAFCVLPCSIYSGGLCAIPGCGLMVLAPYAVGAATTGLGGALLGLPRALAPSQPGSTAGVAQRVFGAAWPLMVGWAGSLVLLHVTAAVGVASVLAAYVSFGLSGSNSDFLAVTFPILGGVALLVVGALAVSTVAMVMGGAVLSWLGYHAAKD